MKFPPLHGFLLLSLSSAPALQAAITVSDFSTAWTPLVGNYDYLADQQGGQPEGDIVGLGTNYGFFIGFNDNGSSSSTDGQLLFRVRLDKAGGNPNSPSFDRVVWVGIDADINGSIDAFVGINRQGNASELGVYEAGNLANTSPNTTSINDTSVNNIITATNSTNYNYRAVDFTSDGGTLNDVTESTTGDPDYYVSFMIPFVNVVTFLAGKSITITDQSPLRYVMATSNQTNSLNQDLGGVDGGVNSTTTWTALGGFTPTAALVPEPSSALLTLGSLVSALWLRRRH